MRACRYVLQTAGTRFRVRRFCAAAACNAAVPSPLLAWPTWWLQTLHLPVQGLEARDNARFLATLERHLRVLEGGSMQAVADALPPLLNALRMVGHARGCCTGACRQLL